MPEQPPGQPAPSQPREVSSSAARLSRALPGILQRWEAAVRAQVPAARDDATPVLLDNIPGFLEQLALHLAGHASSSGPRNASLEHGEQRAGLPGYSVDQVVREYHLLRRVLLEELEAGGPLELSVRLALDEHLDRAVSEAVQQYVRSRDGEREAQFAREREDRRAAEEARAQLTSILESISDAFLAVDREWRLLYANPQAERLFPQYPREEYLGQDIWEAAPAGRETLGYQELQRAMRDRVFVEYEELSPVAQRWLEVRAYPMPEGLAIYLQDITTRKEAEAERECLLQELREADRRKNEFLAMLAHEMRTPLSAITSALYILENAELPGDRGERQLATLTRQAKQLARLAEDLLDTARIREGKIELRKERLDLVALARDAAQSSAPLMDGRGQALHCELPDAPLWVEADAARLEQVITNLLNNAARYTEPGGTIRLSTGREGDSAVLRIRDTGRGIDPILLPQVFDLFVQADPCSRSRGGLGIGLTIVRRLVEMHGGTVEARSEGPGMGSEFCVSLPLADAGSV